MKFVLTPALKHGSAGKISKQSAEPRTVYDYIRHSSGPDVWMWNLEHNKVCVCQDRCILYMGSLQDPEDPLHVSYNKSRSQGSIRVSHALQHGNWTTLEILWSHRTQTITVQLLLWFTSLHQTGNNLQEDLTTRGSEPVESDLRPLNIDASYTWKKAVSREDWHSIVDMAILKKSMLWRQRERERETERARNSSVEHSGKVWRQRGNCQVTHLSCNTNSNSGVLYCAPYRLTESASQFKMWFSAIRQCEQESFKFAPEQCSWVT